MHRRELGAAAPVAAGGRELGGLALRRVAAARAVGAVDVGCDFQPEARRISGAYAAFRLGDGVLSYSLERVGVMLLCPAFLVSSLRLVCFKER